MVQEMNRAGHHWTMSVISASYRLSSQTVSCRKITKTRNSGNDRLFESLTISEVRLCEEEPLEVRLEVREDDRSVFLSVVFFCFVDFVEK